MFKIQKIEDVAKTTEFRQAMYRERLNVAKRLAGDTKAEARKSVLQCVLCFYTATLSGQAFCDYKCVCCGAEGSHPNTNVPVLCDACATEKNLCKQCGAEREFHSGKINDRKSRSK